jgi:hypothetical protein
MERRIFIRVALGAGALVVGGTSLFVGCGRGIRRSDVTPPDRAFETVPELGEPLSRILYYASLAPSGHNSQPWTVTLHNENELTIVADPKRRLPAVDPENREVMLSLGAFLENLTLAAKAKGYSVSSEVIAQSPMDTDIVRVRLSRGVVKDYPMERLTGRMTVKHGYRPDELKADVVKKLSEPFEGHLHYYPRDDWHAKCIREGAVESMRVQLTRVEAQREMAEWVRLDKKSALKHLDGLTTEGMEITGFKGWIVRNFMSPEDFMKKSALDQTLKVTAQLASEGGGWFIITSNGRSVADLIDTGRRFERMALMAREHNVAIQPMTQYLEEESGRKQIADNHDAAIIPQFVLRVGYMDRYPDPVSLRRPVKRFVKRG